MKDKSFTSFFDIINPENEIPVAAIFSSYGFDAELFETEILPIFLGILGNKNEDEQNFRREVSSKLREVSVTVLSDAKEYNGGQSFLYTHKTVNNVTFHPKCHLLLFSSKLRVIIGSCNITKSGLCYNAETIWYDDIYLEKENPLIDDLLEIIKFWEENYSVNDESICEIERYLKLCKISKVWSQKIIHTMGKKTPCELFFDVLKENKIEAKEIYVVSPFFENDRIAAYESSFTIQFFQKIRELYSDCKISILFPGNYNEEKEKYIVSAPVNILEELHNLFSLNFGIIEPTWVNYKSNIDKPEYVQRILHSKLIVVKDKNKQNWVLSGSINFTCNAMLSSSSNLRNIEIGVIDNVKGFELPDYKEVCKKDLLFIQKELTPISCIFFTDAIYENNTLCLTVDKGKWKSCFKLEYSNEIFYDAINLTCPNTGILKIDNFILKKQLTIHVMCESYEFYIPLTVKNKEDYLSDIDEYNFSLTMSDLIDYWSGKYSSSKEIESIKRQISDSLDKEDEKTGNFFTYNLRQYFKALNKISDELKKPFFSEKAFINFLNSPLGLKNLVNLLISNYQEQKIHKQEYFFLEIEIENSIKHIVFDKDRLDKKIKFQLLNDLLEKGIKTRKEIYKESCPNLKEEYNILINSYGLEE